MEMDDKTPPMSFLGAFCSLIELFLVWIQVRMVGPSNLGFKSSFKGFRSIKAWKRPFWMGNTPRLFQQKLCGMFFCPTTGEYYI